MRRYFGGGRRLARVFLAGPSSASSFNLASRISSWSSLRREEAATDSADGVETLPPCSIKASAALAARRRLASLTTCWARANCSAANASASSRGSVPRTVPVAIGGRAEGGLRAVDRMIGYYAENASSSAPTMI